ncbi:hypothetical protein AABM38_12025 [Heyndrickxia sp. MSNUG]|uniref:hypothetical protein n=1 Tax=Heyndrickxia sp. MSNUG TaxID=3136677 RepID=UPI003C2E66F3
MRAFLILLISITLAGCSGFQSNSKQEQEKPTNSAHDQTDQPEPGDSDEKPVTNDQGKTNDTPTSPTSPDSKPGQSDQKISLKDYFPSENQIKYFKGTGNEFAEEKEIVFEMQGNYLPTIVSNGGTSMLKIFKLTEKGIFLVYQQSEYYEKDVPAVTSLEKDFKEAPILTNPISEGTVINGWKIVSSNKNLLLPIGSIKKAVVLEQENQDSSISRQYWAPKYGLVKKEFYMKDSSGSEMLITSELMDTDSRK